MKTFKLKNNIELKVYNGIDELPIVNFQKYNKYLLIDAGLGSDIESIDEHIIAIAKYINKDDKQKAIQELQNMRQNMHLINSEISPKYLAFASLVHSINGEKITDYSDDGLKAILSRINHVSHVSLIEKLIEIKKKVSEELELYFPNDFSDVKEKEMYDMLKRKIQLLLSEIINNTQYKTELEEINDFMFKMHRPKSFVGSESIEIKHDKQFETTCTIISQKTNLDAKAMTVLQFYSTLADIKKQAEAEAKAYKKHRR